MGKPNSKRSQHYELASSVHERIRSELTELLDSALLTTDSVRAFKYRYLRDQVFSKYNDPKEGSADARRLAAIAKWKLMELRNERTNVRQFIGFEAEFLLAKGRKLRSERLFTYARHVILDVLGNTPDLEVLYGTFTDGASTGFKRQPGVVAAKFEMGADITASCLKWFRLIAETCETWSHLRSDGLNNLTVVEGGSLFTVPKNSEIDRCAVKEPEMNMFCQKGVGHFIRSRLRSVVGINLNDQTRNQKLARKGSEDGSLATLDLSSASDLISDGLVRELLPADWYDLLNDIRSQRVLVEGSYRDTNMFSSMGNAFTFELESLIFYALSRAVMHYAGCRGKISVFGDDIIVPSQCAGLLAKVLQFVGLKVNNRKSFWTGPFRESCGKHWYRGYDVTPFYVKEPVGTVTRLIHYLNRLRKWASGPYNEDVLDDRFDGHWCKWSRKVPSALWGGKDLERIDALVTPHRPRYRLISEKKEVEVPQLGAYLQWLRAADGRSVVSEPIVTSKVMVENEAKLRLRRLVVFGRVDIPLFLREWEEWES